MAYQISCEHHGYGQTYQVWDEVKQDKELHIANSPSCESSVEIHEMNSSGGFDVIEGADGTQMPDL